MLLTGAASVKNAVTLPPRLTKPAESVKDDICQREVEELIKVLRDTLAASQEAIPRATGKEIQDLIEALGSNTYSEREAAGIKLEALGSLAKPELDKAASDRDVERAYRAQTILRRVEAKEIAEAQKRRDGSFALFRLGDIGPAAKGAVPIVSELLKHREAAVRLGAAVTLGKIGHEARAAVPALADALKDEDSEVRVLAVAALAWIGPGAKAAVPRLAEALTDDKVEVRANAASALENIGTEAGAAVPALIAALGDKREWVRGNAAAALGKIGPGSLPAVPALAKALKDKETWVRKCAAGALGELGSGAKEAVPALSQMLKDEAPAVRQAAASALANIRGERDRSR
jgi:HEAT repeat protein